MNQDIINRGQAAKRILDNPEFTSTLDHVEKDIFGQFRRLNVSDTEKREDLHKLIYAMDLFVAKLKTYVVDAEIELTRETSIPDA